MDTSHTIEPAQRTAARVGGLLYLLTMANSIFAFSARNRLVLPGDAVETARSIAASETLFRLTIVSDLLTYAGVVVLIWCLYFVLEPVRKHVALLALSLRLVENAVLVAVTLNAFLTLRLLSGAEYLQPVGTEQLQALGRAHMSVYGAGLGVGFVFTGLGSIVFSWLWLKSRYIPRVIAWWGIVSSFLLGLGSLAVILFPDLGSSMGILYMMPMGVYEVGLGLWLLIRGIRE